MSDPAILSKAALARLLVDEVCENVEAREATRNEHGVCPYYGNSDLESGQSPTQIKDDIRRARRALLELWKMID